MGANIYIGGTTGLHALRWCRYINIYIYVCALKTALVSSSFIACGCKQQQNEAGSQHFTFTVFFFFFFFNMKCWNKRKKNKLSEYLQTPVCAITCFFLFPRSQTYLQNIFFAISFSQSSLRPRLATPRKNSGNAPLTYLG